VTNALAEAVRYLASQAVRRFPRRTGLESSTPLGSADRMGYEYEEEARTAISVVRESTQLSYERLVSLFGQVAYLERYRIEGALVECGVWRGGASAMMALANLAKGSERRHLHLFDSFQGMPEPLIERDGADVLSWAGTVGDGALRSTGVNVADAAAVHQLIATRVGYPSEFVHIHEGWFQQTLPTWRKEIGTIALLRLDGDWYESTMVAFQNLYDSVVPGGIVVVDDYGHFAGCRKATDEFLTTLNVPVYLGYIDYTGRYFVKPVPFGQTRALTQTSK
jgi:hypothetical protein